MTVTTAIILMGALAVLTAIFFAWVVARIPATRGVDNEKHAESMQQVAAAIREGSKAFLARQYRYMAVFIVFFAIMVWAFVDMQLFGYPFSAMSFVAGAVISILAGYIGMRAATVGNIRTTAAATRSLGRAFRVAFNTGAVMGFGLVGLALLGLIFMYLVLDGVMGDASTVHVIEA
ncbi:MAG: sodium/proton-translocating pyrophosphatase, partial [Gemmatimonadetes bacterium]|nr:sodium/proton-translocating pyrophosphatase [Gemmatimonadota bacterium]